MRHELQHLVDNDSDLAEPKSLKAWKDRGWLDGVIGVADVEVMQAVARKAVGGDQDAAGSQDPKHLGENSVLQGNGWDMVQHRERADRVEGGIGERHLSGVADDDLDIAAGVLGGEGAGGSLVDFESGQARHPVPQPLGCRSRPGTYLQHVLAEIEASYE